MEEILELIAEDDVIINVPNGSKIIGVITTQDGPKLIVEKPQVVEEKKYGKDSNKSLIFLLTLNTIMLVILLLHLLRF